MKNRSFTSNYISSLFDFDVRISISTRNILKTHLSYINHQFILQCIFSSYYLSQETISHSSNYFNSMKFFSFESGIFQLFMVQVWPGFRFRFFFFHTAMLSKSAPNFGHKLNSENSAMGRHTYLSGANDPCLS